jgi:HlyD family secretion protein
MDAPRTDRPRRQRRRLIVVGAIAALLGGVALALARMEPAVPAVDRSLLWIDTATRGPMVRQARGIGALVAENIAWLAARTEGRVEKVLLRPGAVVTADSVILVLSNPQVEQAAADADSELQSAQSALVTYKAELESAALAAESAAAAARAQMEESRLKAEMNERLFQRGLVPEIDVRLSRVTAEQAATHYEIERKRFAFARQSVAPQLAAKRADVDRLRAQARLRHEDLEALHVKAGMSGVLQSLPVEIGALVAQGANVARVADPTRLKAEIRIPETQAKDVTIGLPASIDTRNGVVMGRVARIDPAAKAGTVLVDVELAGTLPAGARPDLSVDGTIELARVAATLTIGRPAAAQELGTIRLYKVDANERYADKLEVRLGRGSINKIEVVSGLQPGDRVILSDMSRWDSAARIRLE